ncbi:hypothetical protein GALL_540130 [mine drainage metagenome]|uniref:Uncharacterized protein n=1 Tax=mine drainage metagenome TaxID=410659 RepID=A0A1J5PGQ0_9ZZZZ
MRHLQLGMALVFLGADIQQAHARPHQLQPVARIRRAHHGILQQVFGIGLDVGADVQHHVEAALVARGPKAGDRRAIDAGDLAQPDHRQRHQRAGIARRNAGTGFTAFDQINSHAHGRIFFVAHRQCRRLIHPHHFRGMMNTQTRICLRMMDAQLRLDRVLQANQYDIERRIARKTFQCGRHGHNLSVIATRRINCHCHIICHV